MMIERVTGQQARELLAKSYSTTSWKVTNRGIEDEEGYDVLVPESWSVAAQSHLPLAAAAPDLAAEVVRLEYELRRVVATLDRERNEWIDAEEAAIENDEHEEASEADARAQGLDRAIQLIRPLAWPMEARDDES